MPANAVQTQDFDLRSIRGVFWRGLFIPSPESRRGARILGFFFLATPVVIAYAVFTSGDLRPPFTADHWAVLALLLFSPAMGLFVLFAPNREWRFTGDEILEYRNGREVWRVPIDSITEAKIQPGLLCALWLQITANRKHYSIPLVPELRPHFTKSA